MAPAVLPTLPIKAATKLSHGLADGGGVASHLHAGDPLGHIGRHGITGTGRAVRSSYLRGPQDIYLKKPLTLSVNLLCYLHGKRTGNSQLATRHAGPKPDLDVA